MVTMTSELLVNVLRHNYTLCLHSDLVCYYAETMIGKLLFILLETAAEKIPG